MGLGELSPEVGYWEVVTLGRLNNLNFRRAGEVALQVKTLPHLSLIPVARVVEGERANSCKMTRPPHVWATDALWVQGDLPVWTLEACLSVCSDGFSLKS